MLPKYMICRLNFVTLEAKTQLKCVLHHKRTHDLTRKCRSACTSLSLVRHYDGAYATLHSVNYKDSDQTGCAGSYLSFHCQTVFLAYSVICLAGDIFLHSLSHFCLHLSHPFSRLILPISLSPPISLLPFL